MTRRDPSPVRKAVIPAAGFGTRFLPAAKAVPKELLPVLGTPVIAHVVAEAAAAGCTEICIVLRRGKEAIQRLFEPDEALEARIERAGRTDDLALIRDVAAGTSITYVFQPEAAGLGDAVAQARVFCGSDPFLVLSGDTILRPGVAEHLVAAYDSTRTSAVAVQRVGADRVSRYGIVAPAENRQRGRVSGPHEAGLTGGSSQTASAGGAEREAAAAGSYENTADGPAASPGDRSGPFAVSRLVEKPAPEEAPSDFAISARYLFTAALWPLLARTRPGRGGEIQLTDAMDALARTEGEAGGMTAVPIPGKRYDLGNPTDFLACEIELARETLSARELRAVGLATDADE